MEFFMSESKNKNVNSNGSSKLDNSNKAYEKACNDNRNHALDSLDKYLLTFSSTFIVVIAGFCLKFSRTLYENMLLVKLSVIAFFITISLTLIAFYLTALANEIVIKESRISPCANFLNKCISKLNLCCCISFLLAFLLLIIFICNNI